jgi:Tol biopolymer transport system component
VRRALVASIALVLCGCGPRAGGAGADTSKPGLSAEQTQLAAIATGGAPREATPPPEQTASRQPVESLHLSGRLIFFNFIDPGDVMPGLVQMDMATGKMITIFRPPPGAWVNGAVVSPDGKQIGLAYAPPPPAGQPDYGPTDLDLMPAEAGAQPVPLLIKASGQESFFQPAWSADGRYLYYAHFTTAQDSAGQTQSQYRVERIAVPGGSPERVVDRAIWPRLSPDGKRMVYVAYDPAQQVNDLFLAQPDGSSPVALLEHGIFTSVDAPFFTPDGNNVVFSATGLGPVALLSPLERLLGVVIASANGSPSDWWSVPVAGGKPHRITAVYQSGLNGAFSPDGRHIAFVGSNGLFVMDPDGGNLVQLLDTTGTLAMQWLP